MLFRSSGQFARVKFSVAALDRTVIPFGALRRDRDGEYVFLVNAEGKARRVGVRSGRRLADEVEVLEGVRAGDQVVLRGFLGLSNGKQVTVAGQRNDGRNGKGKGDGRSQGQGSRGADAKPGGGTGKEKAT